MATDVTPLRYATPLRDAAIDDAAALARLVTWLGYPTDEAAMRRRLAAIVGRADCFTVVATCDDAVAGFGGAQLCPSYNRDRPSGRIAALVVDARFRGRGVGARLVRELERRLAAAGAGGVFVNSRLHRVGAHRFYERLGYEPNGTRMVRDLAAPVAAGGAAAAPADNDG